jgi:hypothetical protein
VNKQKNTSAGQTRDPHWPSTLYLTIKNQKSKMSMHSPETRTEFLKLRARGWSFSRIGLQLRVSKPTLIAWSRQCAPQIRDLKDAEKQKLQQDLQATRNHEIERLTALIKACQQELFSRQVKAFTTETLEAQIKKMSQLREELNAPNSPPPNTATQ